jgi:hypothetical protein
MSPDAKLSMWHFLCHGVPGEKFHLSLKYMSAQNYPLDLYCLMDFCQSLYNDRDTLSACENKLTASTQNKCLHSINKESPPFEETFPLINNITSFVQESPWETTSHSSRNSQSFMELEGSLPCHRGPPLVPSLSEMHPGHTLHPPSLRSILILSSHLCLGLQSGIFPSGFQTKILDIFVFSMHTTWPAHFIHHNLITNNIWWSV